MWETVRLGWLRPKHKGWGANAQPAVFEDLCLQTTFRPVNSRMIRTMTAMTKRR